MLSRNSVGKRRGSAWGDTRATGGIAAGGRRWLPFKFGWGGCYSTLLYGKLPSWGEPLGEDLTSPTQHPIPLPYDRLRLKKNLGRRLDR